MEARRPKTPTQQQHIFFCGSIVGGTNHTPSAHRSDWSPQFVYATTFEPARCVLNRPCRNKGTRNLDIYNASPGWQVWGTSKYPVYVDTACIPNRLGPFTCDGIASSASIALLSPAYPQTNNIYNGENPLDGGLDNPASTLCTPMLYAYTNEL